MSASEGIGLTKDEFIKLYDENNGFNGRFNMNHTLRNEDESVYSFVRSGANRLIDENTNLVDAITKAGTYNANSGNQSGR